MQLYLHLKLLIGAVCILKTWQFTIPDNFLLLSTRDNIISIDLENEAMPAQFIRVSKAKTIEFDIKNKCLFYYKDEETVINRKCFNLDKDEGITTPLLDVQKNSILSLSYDWISDLLYFIDSNTFSIKAITTTKPGKQLIRTIRQFNINTLPSKLAVDPVHGHLYWMNQSTILRANLDGTQDFYEIYPNHTILLHSLAVDYKKNNKVLLTNTLSNQIHDRHASNIKSPVIKFDFSSFNITETNIQVEYFDTTSLIAAYRDQIYWSKYIANDQMDTIYQAGKLLKFNRSGKPYIMLLSSFIRGQRLCHSRNCTR